MDTIQIVAASFGGFLVLLLLGLVFWRRNLTDAEYTFARIILALALACVAVLISGFLQVEIKGFIQATGAFAVFVIAFFYSPAALQGNMEWVELRRLWRDLRDIHDDPNQANQDDVARALNVVNETATVLATHQAILGSFRSDYTSDYCRLYAKLRKNRYPVGDASTSDAKLTVAATNLAGQLAVRGGSPELSRRA
jgi:hypothetical protein